MANFRSVVARPWAVLLAAVLVLPASARAAEVCVGVSSQAVYRALGYDHIVHLTNHCDKAAACSVSTNVNPDPTNVTVAPNETVDVLTFRGSPARTFTPHVICQPVN